MRQSIGLVFVVMLAICPESAWALANPAAVFCAQSGGRARFAKAPAANTVCAGSPMDASSTSGLTTGRCTGVECRRAVSTHLRAGSMPLSTAAAAHRPISD
jgi:hypothetical protein